MPKARETSKSFQSPRGTHDILPADQPLWEKVRSSIRQLSLFYGFEKIDTPHFEDTDLFTVGVGRATDIVSKQMYSFKTRGGDQLTLRPEGTAAVARAFVEHGMVNWPQPVKLYYTGSFFRHESPQRGRFREFNQWGLEIIGDGEAVADAQIINVFYLFLQEWGLRDAIVEVNSVGCPACRPAYRAQLTQYYRSRVRGLCRECKERFRDNPLRLLDCTEEKCVVVKKSAPQLLDRLCEACRGHFKLLLEFLEESGVPYALNSHLVRGLDYYTRTVFETFLPVIPAPAVPPPPPEHAAGDESAAPAANAATHPEEVPKKLAVVSGGRYDGLIELVGGRPTPAVGGAMGLERLIHLIRERSAAKVPEAAKPKVFLVQLGDLAKKKSFRIMEDLRRSGLTMSESLGRDSIRSQLKIADRVGAEYALIIGQKEALDGAVIVREMSSGIQETIPRERLVETLKRKLKK
ncbi:MAG: histidine--tRNA ligase [Candidatus Sungbacteria bacterium]|uniref:Histidine--tRNA ligase n=1 Tax=Candidatus Sungiibacteriota bacterium TaxID=2750080 RepID=A0A933DR84_9BACT|nr:histidine--tRNA ligase [Candidatus Sungbacteria bacterium]